MISIVAIFSRFGKSALLWSAKLLRLSQLDKLGHYMFLDITEKNRQVANENCENQYFPNSLRGSAPLFIGLKDKIIIFQGAVVWVWFRNVKKSFI